MVVHSIASGRTFSELEGRYPSIGIQPPVRVGELESTIRSECMRGLLVSCQEISTEDTVVISVVSDFPTLPIILLDSMTREGARLAAHLASSSNPYVKIGRCEVESVIRQFLSGFSPLKERLAFMQSLERRLAGLDSRTRASFLSELARPAGTGSVASASRGAGCSESTFRSRLKECGIREPSLVFCAQRVIDGWGFSRDPGYRKGDVARKCGYRRPSALRNAFNTVGVAHPDECADLISGDLLQRVEHAVFL